MTKEKKILWFDFENAPHVWVLKEIMNYFKEKNEVIITARNYGYTYKLCDLLNFKYVKINTGKSRISNAGKLLSVVQRGIRLKKYLEDIKIRPDIAISHGSRSQGLAAYLMKIKTISLDDFENSFKGFNFFVDKILTPFPIKPESWGRFHKKVINYPGLKEELYLWNKENLNIEEFEFINKSDINIIFRPQSNSSHYANEKSVYLEKKILEKFKEGKKINVILFPRDNKQQKESEKYFVENNIKYHIPQGVINGPSLISCCDLLISGGGTMAREASVLGIPSYSFFSGKLGEVDKYLISIGKMKHIDNEEQVKEIKFEKNRQEINKNIKKDAYQFLVKYIEKLLEK